MELINGTSLRTIIFRNHSSQETAAIICPDREVFDHELARIKELPHIEILVAGFSVVAQRRVDI